MTYAPPLVLLAVHPQDSANQNEGVAFCASKVWGKDGAPQLSMLSFLEAR